MDYNTITYEKDAPLGIITLNRPKSLNALNDELLSELAQVFEEIEKEEAISAVIITGSKKAFAAGADIKEIDKIEDCVQADDFVRRIKVVYDRIESFPKPVIAAVSGLALGGGCELCLVCDIRIAADNASFGLPEIKLGVIPGAGGTQRLPRLIGLGRAKEMLFSGEPIDAQEAYRIGLANKVVPADSLLEEAKKMANNFANKPNFALNIIKQVVNEGTYIDLNSGLAHENRCFEMLFSTQDKKEGVQAFLEKREPEFKGK